MIKVERCAAVKGEKGRVSGGEGSGPCVEKGRCEEVGTM